MGEESVDLRKEIAQAKEQINSPDDALADIAIKLQETELQSKLLKVQIEQATLEKENLRIERLRRNNERRPFIFCGVAVVIVLMYLGLISILVRDLWFPCPGLVRVLDRGDFACRRSYCPCGVVDEGCFFCNSEKRTGQRDKDI